MASHCRRKSSTSPDTASSTVPTNVNIECRTSRIEAGLTVEDVHRAGIADAESAASTRRDSDDHRIGNSSDTTPQSTCAETGLPIATDIARSTSDRRGSVRAGSRHVGGRVVQRSRTILALIAVDCRLCWNPPAGSWAVDTYRVLLCVQRRPTGRRLVLAARPARLLAGQAPGAALPPPLTCHEPEHRMIEERDDRTADVDEHARGSFPAPLSVVVHAKNSESGIVQLVGCVGRWRCHRTHTPSGCDGPTSRPWPSRFRAIASESSARAGARHTAMIDTGPRGGWARRRSASPANRPVVNLRGRHPVVIAGRAGLSSWCNGGQPVALSQP